MDMGRDIRVEKEGEGKMCVSLLTAVVVLSMACLKHYSCVSYMIEQWRSFIFLLLNIVLLAVYFTSTRPVSRETHDYKIRRGGRLRIMRGKKKNKTRMVVEPACSNQNILVVEPTEVIKNCIVEETKRARPKLDETAKDYLVEISRGKDEFEPGRLSNEELNERVEAFITTFRQHLLLDARKGRDREIDQKMRTKDYINLLGREVT